MLGIVLKVRCVPFVAVDTGVHTKKTFLREYDATGVAQSSIQRQKFLVVLIQKCPHDIEGDGSCINQRYYSYK